MCEVCRQSICPSSCPNAEEPKPAGKCIVCGGNVYPGESVWSYYGNYIHEDCASDCKLALLLDSLDMKYIDKLGYFEDYESILRGTGYSKTEAPR